jgi:ribulose 1,5-bisphosphate synthetase/thiazole synthase
MAGTSYDLIIIGAGSSGIVTARFYLDIHPSCNLVILESENCVGGVWSGGMLDNAEYYICLYTPMNYTLVRPDC